MVRHAERNTEVMDILFLTYIIFLTAHHASRLQDRILQTCLKTPFFRKLFTQRYAKCYRTVMLLSFYNIALVVVGYLYHGKRILWHIFMLFHMQVTTIVFPCVYIFRESRCFRTNI